MDTGKATSSQYLFEHQPLVGHASPVSIPLPSGPLHSQSEFDALVDLLGTDEPIPPRQLDFNLRDSEGCLDFDKIKSIFTSGEDMTSENKRDAITLEASGVGSSIVTQLDLDHVPGEETFQAGLLATQDEPGQAEDDPKTGNLIDLSVNDPSEGPSVTNKTSHHQNLATREDKENAEKIPSVRAALDIAHEEVEALQEHCKELENLIYVPGGCIPVAAENKRQPFAGSYQQHNGHNDTDPLTVSPGSNIGGIEGKRQLEFNVDSLSLSQAQRMLKRLVTNLAIPASYMQEIFDQIQESGETTIAPASAELLRARDFTLFLDELVWRRICFGSDYDDPLSQENIEALKDRIELWEDVMRSRR